MKMNYNKTLEENIYIESKWHIYFFNICYLDNTTHINVWHKGKKEFLFKNHLIKDFEQQNQIRKMVNLEPGTTFKRGNVKYLVRTHEKIKWDDEKIRSRHFQNPYDIKNRCRGLPFYYKIVPLFKKAWLRI